MEYSFDWLVKQILDAMAWVWALPELKFMLSHIAINVVAAVAVGIYTRTFLLGKLGEFLYRKVLPYTLLYGAFAIFGEASGLSGMRIIAFAAIEAMLLADLLDNVKKIGMHIKKNGGDGFDVPRALTK